MPSSAVAVSGSFLSLSLSLLLLLLFILYISIRLHFFFFFLVDSPWDLLSYYVIFLSGSTCIIVVYCLFLIFFCSENALFSTSRTTLKVRFKSFISELIQRKKKLSDVL